MTRIHTTLTVAVASTLDLKVKAGYYGILGIFPGSQLTMIPFGAASGVSAEPQGWPEIAYGAENRLKDLLNSGIAANFYLSMESGIFRVNGHMFDAAFVIATRDRESKRFYATTCGIRLPENLWDKFEEGTPAQTEWGTMLAQTTTDNVDPHDPHSFMTGKMVPRVKLLTQGVEAAVAQLVAASP